MARLLPLLALSALLAGCQSQVSSTAGASGATLYSQNPEDLLKPSGEPKQGQPDLALGKSYEDLETSGSLISTE